jgi:hypothetical protein
MFDPNTIPDAPELPQAVPSVPAAPKKRKSYYVPVSQRVAADNKNAAKRAMERKAAKASARKSKKIGMVASISKQADAFADKLKKKYPPKSAKKAEGKATSGSSATGETICSICHKPLSKHSSVEAGMGDTCANKIKLLAPGTTLEDHYEKLTVFDVPDGYIKLKDAFDKLREKGFSLHRLLQAVGGDRHLRKPLNPNFKVVFVGRVRYINGACLKNWKDLEKV